ncbi:MAG: prolyl oligopeptidase family serine peptidase [Ekhidna sp.]
MRYLFVLFLVPFLSLGQQKKVLSHEDYNIWRSLASQSISNDGKHIAYVTEPNGYGNKELNLHTFDGEHLLSFPRGSEAFFTNDSRFLIFKISPDFESQRDLRRKKTKEALLPPDTLAIYSIASGELTKIAGLQSFKVPKKWDNYLIYLYEPPADTAVKAKKKPGKKNGYELVVRQLENSTEWTFPFVLNYEIPEESRGLGLATTGNDSTLAPGVYSFDFNESRFKPVFRSKGTYDQLVWDKAGSQFSFISDTDTTKALKRDYHLHYFKPEWDSSKTIVRNSMLEELIVNKDHSNYFSDSGKRLIFQVKEFPVLQDTSLLEEEIVDVEVWNYRDQRLFTQQENDLADDRKFGYLSFFDTESNKTVQLGSEQFAKVLISDQGDGQTSVAIDNADYQKLMSWEGYVLQDLYEVNLATGEKKKVAEALRGNVQLSPLGKYAYWYNANDSAWFTYSFDKKTTKQVTDNKAVPFYNEIHDSPSHPYPYGLMSWTEKDAKMLIYDRYDIWEVDPAANESPRRLTTDGREKRLTYRYIKLDEEERFVKKGQKLILSGFYEEDKHEAVFEFAYGKQGVRMLTSGDFKYDGFLKSRDSERLIFTRENFQVFPDILSTDLSFSKTNRISDVNPQQTDYSWGTIELVCWNSLDGVEMEGMLVKPEGFDPSKKYPLMVNFYEKSSNGLNNHRAPYPHRSTMNYSLFASRGYVIFNPNVNYREGYPGESAFNCVIPGVNALIDQGFIDKAKIGVQGHSWGGYQIAYLLTKTDMFKCAEAGAPVVNMISAYGGIRWGSGLSRMFQYEHTQSRIGGTLWQYPLRYLENSPIFFMDKVNTPVLIMHNDNDGAVPWYQGIEYFVALRRLGKPAWMLNYRGEPHWPQKVQNRIDFNVRLSQFFDHYLKDAPKPKWMEKGVPAIKTGIEQGYELMND